MADRRILFLSETAKTRYEDYVGINDRFAEILTASGILDYPEDHYIFSNDTRDHTPGLKRVDHYKKSDLHSCPWLNDHHRG